MNIPEITFLKSHERLLLVLAGIALLLFLGNKYINASYDRAVANNAVAQEALKQQIAKDQQTAQMVQAQAQQYQQLLQQMQAQNQALTAAISARQEVTRKQQQLDLTLSEVELAARWSQLIKAAPQDVQAGQNSVTISDSGARTTVTQLELVPQLQQDLKDTQAKQTNTESELAGATVRIGGLVTQVDGLKTQLTDKDNACKQQLDLQTKKARKSKIKTFFAGLLVGIGIGTQHL